MSDQSIQLSRPNRPDIPAGEWRMAFSVFDLVTFDEATRSASDCLDLITSLGGPQSRLHLTAFNSFGNGGTVAWNYVVEPGSVALLSLSGFTSNQEDSLSFNLTLADSNFLFLHYLAERRFRIAKHLCERCGSALGPLNRLARRTSHTGCSHFRF